MFSLVSIKTKNIHGRIKVKMKNKSHVFFDQILFPLDISIGYLIFILNFFFFEKNKYGDWCTEMNKWKINSDKLGNGQQTNRKKIKFQKKKFDHYHHRCLFKGKKNFINEFQLQEMENFSFYFLRIQFLVQWMNLLRVM